MFITSDNKNEYKKNSHKLIINNIKRSKTYKYNDYFEDGSQDSKSITVHNSTTIRNIKTRKNASDKSELDLSSRTSFDVKMNLSYLDKNKVMVDNIKKRAMTYKYNDNFEDGVQNSISITKHKSAAIRNIKTRKNASDEGKLDLRSHYPFDSKMNSLYLDKNKFIGDKRIEIFTKPKKPMLTMRNELSSYKKLIRENMKTLRRNVIYNNQLNGLLTSSSKYRIMRTPGCWRPIFILIIRNSNNDSLLPNSKTGMSYLIFKKSDTFQGNQYCILNNYSLI